MQLALDDAGIAAGQVGYVSAHATSTPGATARRPPRSRRSSPAARTLHVSAVKSMTGHLLGAAGALGALAAVLAIDRGVIAPTINLENLDPGVRRPRPRLHRRARP